MNNLAILKQTAQTMSSREIAQLCQKPHDNVLKLIRSLIDGGIVKSTTPHQYMHPQNGQWYTEFLSDKRDSLVVVARLSPEFTAAVIDRWQELETQNNALPNFADPVQAARAWADAMERQQQAIAQVAELQPKAQALDAITHAKGNSNIRDTAKALGAKQSDFISWCLKHGWLYRDDCERLKAYANRIQQGFMAQKSVLYRGSDSTERATMQPMFTPKGLTHLAKIYTREVA
nr:phage antirepressor KilAC domain-containing protein [Moraxella sp. CTOTU48268]